MYICIAVNHVLQYDILLDVISEILFPELMVMNINRPTGNQLINNDDNYVARQGVFLLN